ncbi:MAG: PDZ domain-containing protein [Myxococcota bacterium]|nr:PDZ domain-containing protein [Myxococcota bacterium]
MRGWQLAAAAMLGLVIGFLVWGGRDGDRQPLEPETPEVVTPVPDPEAQRLEEQLDREEARRIEPQRELSPRPTPPVVNPPTPPVVKPPKDEARERALEEIESLKAKRREEWFDNEVLLRGGFDPEEIEALNEYYELIELERLFVRDEATREGWLGKPRYHRRMRELDERYNALRFEYGDDRYDWLLYASGEDNRVRVQRVMQHSSADDVGVEPGDIILSYEGERIFDVPSLQHATSGGRARETVSLDVEREGEHIRLYPPRGPLGVVLVPLYVRPAPPY